MSSEFYFDSLLQHTILVDGVERSFILYRPSGLTSQVAAPLVLVFHGSGTTATEMIEFCGLNALAASENFVVAYLNGTGRVDHARSFNAGRCCGYASRHQVDDIAFVNAILDKLIEANIADSTRVYATGMSAGAMMCYRLAVELPDRIGAIAPVAGPMECDVSASQSPMPICHFHGLEDAFVPYSGGYGRDSLSRISFASVEATLEQWRVVNRCEGETLVCECKSLIEDGTSITTLRYDSSVDAPIELHRIHGGGHTWPGRQPTFDGLGRATGNLDANQTMWKFFQSIRDPLVERGCQEI